MLPVYLTKTVEPLEVSDVSALILLDLLLLDLLRTFIGIELLHHDWVMLSYAQDAVGSF